jgi:hypothetical protein
VSILYIEYGYRDADGEIQWPDMDDELIVDRGGPIYAYARASTKDGAEVDVKRLLEGAAKRGATLVSRAISLGAPEVITVPLPETPGSLVRATYGNGSDERRVLAFHTGDESETEWAIVGARYGFEWTNGEDLRSVEVVYDAGADS